MSKAGGAADTSSVIAPETDRTPGSREQLLLAQCAGAYEGRPPAAARLQRLLGAQLTQLLVLALAGDHRMASRDRFA